MNKEHIVYLYEEYDEGVSEKKVLFESKDDANKACARYNMALVMQEWMDIQDTYRESEHEDSFVDMPLVDISVVPRQKNKPKMVNTDAEKPAPSTATTPIHCARPYESIMLSSWMHFLTLVANQTNRTDNSAATAAAASPVPSLTTTQIQDVKTINAPDIVHIRIQDVNVWTGSINECVDILRIRFVPLINTDTNILQACRDVFPECELSDKCMIVKCTLRCSAELCAAFKMDTPTKSYTVWRSQCGVTHSSLDAALLEIAGNALVTAHGSAEQNTSFFMLPPDDQVLIWKWIVASHKHMDTFCNVVPMTVHPSSTRTSTQSSLSVSSTTRV